MSGKITNLKCYFEARENVYIVSRNNAKQLGRI